MEHVLTVYKPPLQHSQVDEIPTPKTPSIALPIEWIEWIFAELFSIYGSEFSRLWAAPGADQRQIEDHAKRVKKVWAHGLAKCTREELRTGIEACRNGKQLLAPTMPRFLSLCRPLVDPETSFCLTLGALVQYLAGKPWNVLPQWYWAYREIGDYDFRSKSYPQIKSRWIAALSATEDKHDPVPEFRKALPPSIVDRRVAQDGINAAKQALGIV